MAKKSYFQKTICKSKNDIKTLWKNGIILIKSHIKRKNLPDEISNDTETVTGAGNVSNLFNKYFTSIGPKLASKLNFDKLNIAPTNFNLVVFSSVPYSFFLKPITEMEVIGHLRNLQVSKSTGTNGIPIKYIKMSTCLIAPILTKLFNECIITGYFSQAFKTAEIIPTYKSVQEDMCSNYRPISILKPIAKIFEKCLHDQLHNYFISKNLLSPSQYGFKKNISTAQAVNDTYNEILQHLNKKHSTCAVFLDLSKAFGTIDHNILINKLNKYGIRGCPLTLFENYLTMRYQYTVVNGVKSHNNLILCGYRNTMLDTMRLSSRIHSWPTPF